MKKSTASKETTEQINTPNRPSNGYELAPPTANGVSTTNSVEIRPTNGHEILVNGISIDDNTINFQNRNDDDDGEGSSVVIEIIGGVENFIGEAENGTGGGENGVGVIEINGADDNEMETISYDANIAQDADVCCASCSSSLSNHSQGADFLDIDLDAEQDDDQDEVEEDYFDLNAGLLQQQHSESFERNNNPVVENNLSQNEQLCQSYSPPSCVTPQLNDMMEQLPGPSSYCRTADEPEDEGVICQDAPVVPVTSCSADCEACIRADMQIIGVLPTRLENDSAFGSGAGTSSATYRRRASQFFCVGGPLGKQIAEETFVKISPGPASTENDSYFIMSTEDAKKLNMQIGPSACGATSVSNVLTILKWNHINLEQISYVVSTRTRAVGSPLAEYLLSRSVAGVSHLDLISAMENLTFQQIKGRFFHLYPKRHVNISQWLMKWLKKGAVPVLTANLQRGVTRGQPIADAWHHQMVIGATANGVVLTNPVEHVTECVLQDILCSPSVLLVRSEDVHQHWTKGCDLNTLLNNTDSRWTEMNVIGQVLCVIREFSVGRNRGEPMVTHVAIPACYLSGVTLFAPANSTVWLEINESDELPVASELKLNLLPSSVQIF